MINNKIKFFMIASLAIIVFVGLCFLFSTLGSLIVYGKPSCYNYILEITISSTNNYNSTNYHNDNKIIIDCSIFGLLSVSFFITCIIVLICVMIGLFFIINYLKKYDEDEYDEITHLLI